MLQSEEKSSMDLSKCCQEYIVFDHRAGDEISTACGRATRALFLPLDLYNNSARAASCFSELEEELLTICDKHHIPTNICNEALEFVRQESGTKTRIIAAQSLHKALLKHDAPRSFKEISSMFYIPFNTIAKYEGVSSLKPSDLCSRVLTVLRSKDNVVLTKSQEKEIEDLADDLFENHMCCGSPQAALGVSILITCKDSFPLTDIAHSCHISKQTLGRHAKVQAKRIKGELSR